MDPATPNTEADRLAALATCAILDTAREPQFDNLVFTTAQIFRTSMAVLGIVDAGRIWFKSVVGPLRPEGARAQSFLDAVVVGGQVIILEDAVTDPRLVVLPLEAGQPPIRFAAGAPVKGPGGHVVGALCVFDRLSRNTSDRQRTNLLQLALEAGDLLRTRAESRFPDAGR